HASRAYRRRDGAQADRAEPSPDRALGRDPDRDEAADAAAPEAARAAARRRGPRRLAHPGDARVAVPGARRLRRSRRVAGRDGELPAAMSALAHVRVLDLTRFLAGPFCTTMLADMGAQVVKVEAPKGGDEGRYGYPPVDGVPVFFLALNRNKKGITLDLRKD